jgi:hypothetical protein
MTKKHQKRSSGFVAKGNEKVKIRGRVPKCEYVFDSAMIEE